MKQERQLPKVYTRYPAPTVLEKLYGFLICVVFIPIGLAGTVWRRLCGQNKDVPFGRDLLLSVFRSTLGVPTSVKRSIIAQTNVKPILDSNRFAYCSQDLLEHVSHPQFEGYWVCQGTPGRKRAPRDCDIVLLHMHGGAYVVGNPSQNFVQLLCTAERVAEAGLSTCILSLQYSLAPENAWPCQLDEAVAAYEFLFNEIGVDPQKIILMGESAGGHLVLALLYELSLRQLPKPRGAVLVFPWVDLTNSSPSMERNKHKDMVAKESLDRAVASFMYPGNIREQYAHLLNMSAEPRSKDLQNWKQVLPNRNWVYVGTHDSFFDSITMFVERARQQGADVDLEVAESVPHGWTAFFDGMDTSKYLKLGRDKRIGEGIMKAATMYGKAIVNMMAVRS